MDDQEPRKKLEIDKSKENDPIVLILSIAFGVLVAVWFLSSVLVPGY